MMLGSHEGIRSQSQQIKIVFPNILYDGLNKLFIK